MSQSSEIWRNGRGILAVPKTGGLCSHAAAQTMTKKVGVMTAPTAMPGSVFAGTNGQPLTPSFSLLVVCTVVGAGAMCTRLYAVAAVPQW